MAESVNTMVFTSHMFEIEWGYAHDATVSAPLSWPSECPACLVYVLQLLSGISISALTYACCCNIDEYILSGDGGGMGATMLATTGTGDKFPLLYTN